MTNNASAALTNSAANLKAIVDDLARITETSMAPTDRVDLEELKGRALSLSTDVASAIPVVNSSGAHVAPHGQVAPTHAAFIKPVKKASDVAAELTTINRTQLNSTSVDLIDTLQLRASRLSADIIEAQGRHMA